ncbi:MAG: hypothetical protein QME66_04170 [Candidatus Eisenbacteria bacterium]|nr:hypothetical protein [Candidatus Eisenbacteria bacterium]
MESPKPTEIPLAALRSVTQELLTRRQHLSKEIADLSQRKRSLTDEVAALESRKTLLDQRLVDEQYLLSKQERATREASRSAKTFVEIQREALKEATAAHQLSKETRQSLSQFAQAELEKVRAERSQSEEVTSKRDQALMIREQSVEEERQNLFSQLSLLEAERDEVSRSFIDALQQSHEIEEREQSLQEIEKELARKASTIAELTAKAEASSIEAQRLFASSQQKEQAAVAAHNRYQSLVLKLKNSVTDTLTSAKMIRQSGQGSLGDAKRLYQEAMAAFASAKIIEQEAHGQRQQYQEKNHRVDQAIAQELLKIRKEYAVLLLESEQRLVAAKKLEREMRIKEKASRKTRADASGVIYDRLIKERGKIEADWEKLRNQEIQVAEKRLYADQAARAVDDERTIVVEEQILLKDQRAFYEQSSKDVEGKQTLLARRLQDVDSTLAALSSKKSSVEELEQTRKALVDAMTQEHAGLKDDRRKLLARSASVIEDHRLLVHEIGQREREVEARRRATDIRKLTLDLREKRLADREQTLKQAFAEARQKNLL